jgi:hypothetical protein
MHLKYSAFLVARATISNSSGYDSFSNILLLNFYAYTKHNLKLHYKTPICII